MDDDIDNSTLAIRLQLDNGIVIQLRATSKDCLLIEVEDGYVMALPHEPHYIELEFCEA